MSTPNREAILKSALSTLHQKKTLFQNAGNDAMVRRIGAVILKVGSATARERTFADVQPAPVPAKPPVDMESAYAKLKQAAIAAEKRGDTATANAIRATLKKCGQGLLVAPPEQTKAEHAATGTQFSEGAQPTLVRGRELTPMQRRIISSGAVKALSPGLRTRLLGAKA